MMDNNNSESKKRPGTDGSTNSPELAKRPKLEHDESHEFQPADLARAIGVDHPEYKNLRCVILPLEENVSKERIQVMFLEGKNKGDVRAVKKSALISIPLQVDPIRIVNENAVLQSSSSSTDVVHFSTIGSVLPNRPVLPSVPAPPNHTASDTKPLFHVPNCSVLPMASGVPVPHGVPVLPNINPVMPNTTPPELKPLLNRKNTCINNTKSELRVGDLPDTGFWLTEAKVKHYEISDVEAHRRIEVLSNRLGGLSEMQKKRIISIVKKTGALQEKLFHEDLTGREFYQCDVLNRFLYSLTADNNTFFTKAETFLKNGLPEHRSPKWWRKLTEPLFIFWSIASRRELQLFKDDDEVKYKNLMKLLDPFLDIHVEVGKIYPDTSVLDKCFALSGSFCSKNERNTIIFQLRSAYEVMYCTHLGGLHQRDFNMYMNNIRRNVFTENTRLPNYKKVQSKHIRDGCKAK